MLSWKQIVQDYIIKYSDRIKKTTAPLRDHLGVDYFTYHRIDQEGNYTVLLDRPDWAECYVEGQFYLQDPYLRHPDVYSSGICKMEANGSEEYLDLVVGAGMKLFQFDMNVMLIEKTDSAVEFFGFTGNTVRCKVDVASMSRPHLLKSFAAHFRKEMEPILSQMGQQASSLKELKGPDFFTKTPILPWMPPETVIAYLRDLGLHKEVESFLKLSKRELECLHYLLMGKSAKETAASLKISHRTIESYIESMKNKLGCFSKSQLFTLATLFHELGLI